MKKICCVFIALVLCLTVIPVNVSAATMDSLTGTVEPRFTAINSIYSLLQIDEKLGIATCVGEMQAKEMVPVKVIVQLQRLENGVWNTLQTWSNTGTFYATKAGSYAIARGYTYRTKTIAFVYDNDGNIVESGSGSHQVDFPRR